jgi:integrase
LPNSECLARNATSSVLLLETCGLWVSWHSFRHTNATLLGEVGESVKTAQSILGHSDLETTLNTYMHAIPDSQRRAVERVAGVVFPDVPKSVPVVVPTGRLN